MIELRDLTKTYGTVHAVRGLTFQIPRGQVVGFLGPNGAGKSTTMKMLTGYIAPTSGKVTLAGINVAKDPVEVRRHVGYLPENNPLYDDMMVLDYLQFIAHMREIPSHERKKKIQHAAERCGLGPVLGKDIGQLSKGYRQRVGLAQAIVHEPPILILDEPTSGLDPNQIVEIRALIKTLGEEKTVLMSTHILSEVESTCSRALIINEGTLVADDTPEQLARCDGGEIYVVVAPNDDRPLVPEQVQMHLGGLAGVTSVEALSLKGDRGLSFFVRYNKEDPRKALFERVVSQAWVLLEMRKKEDTLEERFRRLTME